MQDRELRVRIVESLLEAGADTSFVSLYTLNINA
jgi:hypothetical protein